MLVLGEGVEANSWLLDIEGTSTVDSVIDVELVDCGMVVVETGVMVELVTDVVETGVMVELVTGVVETGGTVLERIVVDVVITVDVGSEIEVIDGDGVSQIVYSQCKVYEI